MYRIRVLGRDLQVRSTAPPETVHDIEAFVNRKIADVAASITGGDIQVVAILALMTIAEDYLSLVKSQESRLEVEPERVKKLIEKLDRFVQGA